MTENERQQILAYLDEGAKALLDASRGVSEEQALRVPAAERW